MKKILAFLFISISITNLSAQKKLTGAWEGKLNIGAASIRLVFHFDQQKDGEYTGSMDSPDQGATGIAFDKVGMRGDSVALLIRKINGGFDGLMTNDSTIDGNFHQGGKSLPMTLKKSSGVIKIAPPKKSMSKRNVKGIWEGKLNVNSISVRINFHFDKQKDDIYTGTMDSPDQGVMGVPCQQVVLTGDSIDIEVNMTIKMRGVLADDTSIIGYWNQGNKTFPISLNKVKELSKNPNRPQTPKPPYSYNSEDIEYDNADKSVHFGATFTYPKGAGPFPTAILITGSGQQDRDETLLSHKPFAVIADYLTKKGIAVLRVDDRGMGKSTGDVQNATSADFANDVEVGLAYLKNRKEVDQKRMGMIGHSEGGLIASIVAARNPDIDFVIMLAGPGVKGSDVLLKQTEDIMISEGTPAETVRAYCIIFKQLLQDFTTNNDTSLIRKKVTSDFAHWKSAQTETTLKALKIGLDSSDDYKLINLFMHDFSSPWTNYFVKSDPRPLIEKFRYKVLALDGSKDLQVNAEMNLAGINKALKKSKSPSFETKELPGLNHLFQHCKKCTIEEYGELEETFSPEALEIMWKWLEKNEKEKRKEKE